MGEKRQTTRISKRAVDAAAPGASLYRLWDSELKGFGLRVTPSGAKTYFAIYRVGGGRTGAQREFTIGRHGVLTPDQARKEAERLLSAARLGGDPQADRTKARADLTVAELCDRYLADGVATKKASTLASDRFRIDAHIKPILGRKRLSSVTSADVERFMRDVADGRTAVVRKPSCKVLRASGVRITAETERLRRGDAAAKGGKGTATRTVGLLGGIFTFAVKQGWRADNPVRGIERFKDRKFQRFLTGVELRRLSAALTRAAEAGANPKGLAIIRLLVFTGARKAEIEHLRWTEVDFQHSCLRLKDSKTGGRVVPIGAPALQVLASLPHTAKKPFVFPAEDREDSAYGGAAKLWERQIRPAADLEGVRLHDLRHTYASLAAAGGQSLPVIAAILGHKDTKTTAQYAHLADDPVRAAADHTARAAAAAMDGLSEGAILMPLRRAW